MYSETRPIRLIQVYFLGRPVPVSPNCEHNTKMNVKGTITLTNNVFTCFSMRYDPPISFPLAKAATIKIKRSNWKRHLENSVFNAAHIKYIQEECLEQLGQILEKLAELNSGDS